MTAAVPGVCGVHPLENRGAHTPTTNTRCGTAHRLHTTAHHTQKNSPQNSAGSGSVALVAPVHVAGRTPRARALAVLALAAAAGLIDLVSTAAQARARDCQSLQALSQACDLHVCEAVPQASPSRERLR